MAPKAKLSDKSRDKQKGLEVFSESAMRNNFSSLEYSRRAKQHSGMAEQALFWEAKAGFEWRSYFLDRTLSVTHSIVGGLFTYILFWVFLYGMVHVY
ncbi:hypothetical protein OSTOST_16413 [Ostertagia ostertagi]